MPICNISKFDYFNHIDHLLEHTKVIVGSDLINLIIEKLSCLTYLDYQNNKTCNINICFSEESTCDMFWEIMESYNLEQAYSNQKFYETIAEISMIAGGFKSECCYTSTFLTEENNPEFFRPKMSEDHKYISIKIPNTNVLYIKIIPNLSSNIAAITGQVLLNIGNKTISDLLSRHKSHIYYPGIIEKDRIYGTRIGVFTIYENSLYIISDMSFQIGQVIEDIVTKLYNRNNIDKVEAYIESNKSEWNHYRNSLLTSSA